MELPKERVPSSRSNPKLLTLFGQSKVGKTTVLSKLDGCLIIDTEAGTDMVSAMKVQANNLKEFGEVFKALLEEKKTNSFQYKYIAVDTLDNLVDWIERGICKANGVTNLIGMPYGAGYNETRLKTMTWIRRLKSVTPHLILIGHRKKTIINEEADASVSVQSLDLSGKLKNLIMADSDAIGYMFRERQEDGTSILKVSFRADDELEAGTRQEHLVGKVMPFDWDQIYID
ncbi:AAA family ATPase [Zeaxanthinibacter sp. PT1]|uniref:AAA family ATPase n=1 Tax=Zeaxanthinibacter TaxID=561554 RepID=UPI00234A6E86|nr:AAA family ATPase [Zeaxanthinibacter sp. PT1]MDC6350728.1 AAA family ATPase [Zeaxanthinibacter sp. PT1]